MFYFLHSKLERGSRKGQKETLVKINWGAIETKGRRMEKVRKENIEGILIRMKRKFVGDLDALPKAHLFARALQNFKEGLAKFEFNPHPDESSV